MWAAHLLVLRDGYSVQQLVQLLVIACGELQATRYDEVLRHCSEADGCTGTDSLSSERAMSLLRYCYLRSTGKII